MIKPFQVIINKGFRKEMDLLFGEGSKVEFTRVDYITNNKSVSIHVKLRVSDIEKGVEAYPAGLIMLIEDGWKMFFMDYKVQITSSIDVLLL